MTFAALMTYLPMVGAAATAGATIWAVFRFAVRQANSNHYALASDLAALRGENNARFDKVDSRIEDVLSALATEKYSGASRSFPRRVRTSTNGRDDK